MKSGKQSGVGSKQAPPIIGGNMIKVRAVGENGKMAGYYDNKRRRTGEVFEIKDEKEFSNAWMEKVELESERNAYEKVVEAPREPQALSRLGRKPKKVVQPEETVNQDVI